MGRRSLTGGVRAKGDDRIEFTFVYKGQRYRPTLSRIPSEANLRRARQQLADIKDRIRHGTFVFADEFPDYRYTDELAAIPITESDAPKTVAKQDRTCDQVFDSFIKHCEMRVAHKDMAFSTLEHHPSKQWKRRAPDGMGRYLSAVTRPIGGAEPAESEDRPEYGSDREACAPWTC